MLCFGYIVEHFALLFIISFMERGNLDFVSLPCGSLIFLSISTKRSTILKILAKLKVEIFAEQNFAEFLFTIYDPTTEIYSGKK